MTLERYRPIKIDDIFVPERIRPVNEEQAKVIAASIEGDGLLNPITVRHTPNAKGANYTLVAGAHRLRAIELCGKKEVDAIVVKADKTAAQILEVSENLYRNELSVIERAAFVKKLRDLYEQENGKITRGGDQRAKAQVDPLFFGKGFSDYISDRLGLSPAAAKRLNKISQNLNPVLRDALRKTPIADNQAQLLKLVKLENTEQQRFAIALRETKGDYKKSFELLNHKPLTKYQKSQADICSKIIVFLFPRR